LGLAKKDNGSKSHPPYNPDLAPSDFYLFVPLKDTLQRHCFADDEELECSVGEELQWFRKEFYASTLKCLTQRRIKCVDSEPVCRKNQFQFQTVIILSQKKQ
jgi:hypothetical protein